MYKTMQVKKLQKDFLIRLRTKKFVGKQIVPLRKRNCLSFLH